VASAPALALTLCFFHESRAVRHHHEELLEVRVSHTMPRRQQEGEEIEPFAV
jgi:hypothetical protein